MNWILHNKEWLFSGIGGTLLIGVVVLIFRTITKRRADIPSTSESPAPSPTAPTGESRFTKPTPDQMTKAVQALPPFQQQAAEDAYIGLRVCWQGLFRGIVEDLHDSRSSFKAWMVNLKHYDPSVRYTNGEIVCPGISLETYPEFKSMHRNELVAVSGTVQEVSYYRVLLSQAHFEFTGRHIGKDKD